MLYNISISTLLICSTITNVLGNMIQRLFSFQVEIGAGNGPSLVFRGFRNISKHRYNLCARTQMFCLNIISLFYTAQYLPKDIELLCELNFSYGTVGLTMNVNENLLIFGLQSSKCMQSWLTSISIYKLGDVGISSNLIGLLSLTNGHCPPPGRWIMKQWPA